MALSPSLLLPVLQAKHASGIIKRKPLNETRQDAWLRTAVIGPDQLRQRVAFALSEIMVVSQRGPLFEMPFALASYYDLLSRNAFGNFRQLMEEVTLHPAMGKYLTMLGNQKPDAAHNIRPDENYARELLQLFTIGLVQLNPDGSVQTDASGAADRDLRSVSRRRICKRLHGLELRQSRIRSQRPAHNCNPDVADESLRRAALSSGPSGYLNTRARCRPSCLLARRRLRTSPERSTTFSITLMLRRSLLCRLIQRLVTSNPSPAYVTRVASVFEDDGAGRRGELGAVVRAILLDPEARPNLETASDVTGKVKEPLLRLIQLWRAYDARAGSGIYRFTDADLTFGQGHLLSPSVFNFFPARIRAAGRDC